MRRVRRRLCSRRRAPWPILKSTDVAHQTVGDGKYLPAVGVPGDDEADEHAFSHGEDLADSCAHAPQPRPARPAVVALAQITAAGSGLLTKAAKEGPFGFCHFAARPGDLVALDTFYVGKVKGVGTAWQLTAVDTATRWVIRRLVRDKSAQGAADFVDHVIERLAEIGVELTRVLTDNGPEFTGKAFTGHLADLATHHAIRSCPYR